MIRSIAAFLLVVCVRPALAAIPTPDDPAAVAGWFAQVLRDADLSELQRSLEPRALFRAWEEPRDLFSRYECISAEPAGATVEWLTPDAALVRIHMRATGLTRAEWHPRFALPERWRLDLRRQPDGAWRIRSVMTEERSVAQCMLAERAPRDADAFFFSTAADPLRVLSLYISEPLGDSKSLEYALVLARESGSAAHESEALQRHGTLAASAGKPGSLDRIRQAVEVARSTNDPELTAKALLRLGSTSAGQRKLEEALAPLSEAASLADSSADPVPSLKALYMHGYVLGQLNRSFASLLSSERLLLLSRRYRWREGEQVAAFARGGVLIKLGKLDAAMASYRQAAALARANGNADHASMAWHNVATVYSRQRRFDEAVAAQKEAVAACPLESQASRGFMYTKLALYQVMAGRLEEAAQSLDAAAPLLGGGDGAFFIVRSGLRHGAGKMDEALADALTALDHLERTAELPGIGEDKAKALTAAGRALRALGRRDEAIQTLRNAVDLTEAERRHALGLAQSKISIFERQLAPYVELVEMLAEREETIPEALRVAEQFKARTLLDVSVGNATDLSAELSAQEREREKTLEARVVEGNRALLRSSREHRDRELAAVSAARVELESFRSEMRLRYPRLAQRDVGIPEALALPDSDAVELVVTDRHILAFIVPAAGSGRKIRTVDIAIGRSDLTARIERYLHALSGRSFGYRADARALYDALIAPLAPHLGGDGPLYIIPDGPLWSLPFHTLIAPDGTHLAEQRAVIVAPSLAILHAGRRRHDGGATLLAFGNPNVGGTVRETVRAAAYDIPMSSLPEAEAEVRRISELYDGGTIHVGEEATESAFKRESAKYRILHLAMHGFVASGAPMYSGLVFGSDPENDGILEAREVAEMKLDADLAVLSACETAAGEISGGEGVVGLSWAFLAAGCPTTVVSHWKADSAATARLMVEFHRHVRQGNPPAEALRRAQLSLMRSDAYRHPYYWAPFIVVGRNAAIGN